MKYYRCDYDTCKKEYVIRVVRLTGFMSSQGDILIEGGRRKDFCSRNCLIEWMKDEVKDEKGTGN